jgi:cobalt-zinc-cadmium efflux system membrane fusion protein
MMTILNTRHHLATVWVLALALVLFLTPAVAQDEHDHEAEGEHEAVVLSAEEQAEFGIETAPAGPWELTRTLRLPAGIHPNDDRLAHIVPRYEGIVTEVLVKVGDDVTVGQTLASIEGDASLAVYTLKTRIAGTVISKHITLGEAVDRESTPFVIADLSTVWLDIHVFQRDLGQVTAGQRVTIIAGPDRAEAEAVIHYVAPVVDESTRTSIARAVLDNSDGRWRPGMFVTVLVETGTRQAPVTVPESALFTLDGESVVFTADAHGFEVREVETGDRGDGHVEILAGLQAEEVVVVKGGFTLKAELEKSSFGHGHNH